MDDRKLSQAPVFYTVQETAAVLRCGASTLYRAIRENTFPAVRVGARYVIPAVAIERLVQEAAESGECIDIAKRSAEQRTAREVARVTGL